MLSLCPHFHTPGAVPDLDFIEIYQTKYRIIGRKTLNVIDFITFRKFIWFRSSESFIEKKVSSLPFGMNLTDQIHQRNAKNLEIEDFHLKLDKFEALSII